MLDLRSAYDLVETARYEEIFTDLNRLVFEHVGGKLFSCSTMNLKTQKTQRVHSSNPAAYPVSGEKDIPQNKWAVQVLDRGKPFVANTIEEISQVFPDHELIAKLGCQSVLNLPIFLAGNMLGTVNLLDEQGFFTQRRLEMVNEFKTLATLAFAAMPKSSAQHL